MDSKPISVCKPLPLLCSCAGGFYSRIDREVGSAHFKELCFANIFLEVVVVVEEVRVMRTGGSTVQQVLTSEAASVLKHALGLARRRGHAQVTPLHVAATLLSSTREAVGLFRQAFLRSHPHHRSSHLLHCRALELCFNVALSRLPTCTVLPSSAPLVPTNPTLSNALVAALKRAQAHQRRGCIEQQQQQQPLLTIKVELEQLVISILDDPSVSRVMREAGFSSTCIKKNLEEDSSSSSSVFFDPYHHREVISPSSFWQTCFMRPPVEPKPLVSSPASSSLKEDLRLVMQVLLGKNKRRGNAVVVGDSVSYCDGLVVELMAMVQRGEVPDELRSTQFVRFQHSSAHLRLMNRGEVETRVSDLRRNVASLASGRGGVIIYVGDLRWAVDDEIEDGESPGSRYGVVNHVIAEVGRLLSELRGCSNGDVSSCSRNNGSRVWLMATANYKTYMRCKTRQPSLESQWELQPVTVPSGELVLGLHAQSDQDSRMAAVTQDPLHSLESNHFNQSDEQDRLIWCAECTASFYRGASLLKSGHMATPAYQFYSTEAKDESSSLPFWLQPHRPDNQHKDVLAESRRQWNRHFQSLHHTGDNRFDRAIGSCQDRVIKTDLQVEAASSTDVSRSQDPKREAEVDPPTPSKPKIRRTSESNVLLDLNVSAEDLDYGSDEEEHAAIPSDLTQETDDGDLWVPGGFLAA